MSRSGRRLAPVVLLAALVGAGCGVAAASVADNPKEPRAAGAKAAETTFVVHDILVRPFVLLSRGDQSQFEKLYGSGAKDVLPSGRVFLVSTVRALYEPWQVVVLGPERFSQDRQTERFTIEQGVYHNADCTPYDPVIVQLEAYLVPDDVTLPSAVDATLQRGGVVADGTERQTRPVRQQLASLDTLPGVIHLGHFGDTLVANPETVRDQKDQLYTGIGNGLRGSIRWEWSNEYRVNGPCGAAGGGTTATTPTTTTTPTELPGTYACTGSIVKLFDDTNGAAVKNGATQPTFSTGGKSYCLTSITTYHWNDGKGATPGSLSLGGSTVLPWSHATGEPGQNGVPGANWTVTYGTHVNPVVIDGTYACRDSDPVTWSANRESGGKGFCVVYGIPATRTG